MYLPTVDDEGYSVGAAVVQSFDKFGIEIYGSYRLHSLDRDVEPEVQDINLFALGTRVKFWWVYREHIDEKRCGSDHCW